MEPAIRPPSNGLKLLALEADDLAVVASACQDGLIKVGDMSYDRARRRFSLIMNRFCWERAKPQPPYERVRAGLVVEGVLSVKAKRVRQDAKDAVLSLLSLRFDPAEEPPGGVLALVLAGGGEIALEAECLDVSLVDLSNPWLTRKRPDHQAADADALGQAVSVSAPSETTA
ncbi:MAG: DUF2948 family protein [Maricaulaceae bacterium]